MKYKGEKTYEAIMRFVLDRLDVEISEISKSVWNKLLNGKDVSKKPTLVFVCGENRYCFTDDERLRVAAIFVSFLCNFIRLK